MAGDHRFEGVVRPKYHKDQYQVIRVNTSGGSKRNYSRCDLVLLVAKDYSHVLIGGGEYGFDGLAREADAVEVEALSERFNVQELWQFAKKMMAAVH